MNRLIQVLKQRKIEKLYTHQASAIAKLNNGSNVIVVTPTASGKTLCYNLPIMDAIIKDKNARALYIFPTKALAQDQLAELYEIVKASGQDIKTYTYDGDTPASARHAIRTAGTDDIPLSGI